MSIELRLPGLIFLLVVADLHAADPFDTNLAAMASEAEERYMCVDKLSVSLAARWLRVLPGETVAKLDDPVVKRAAQGARSGYVDETTELAARRMLAYAAAVRGTVNHNTVERDLADLRREYRNIKIPPTLEAALNSEGKGAESYISTVVRAIRPGHIECWEAFQQYVVGHDVRMAQIPTAGPTRSPWASALQQTRPGIDEPGEKYRVPGEKCGVPAEDHFNFDPSSSRVSGTYDSLGFPEVVFLKYGSGKTCTGTLLSPVWVITAAHCVLEKNTPNNYETLEVSLNHEVANARGNKRSLAKAKKDRIFVPQLYRDISARELSEDEDLTEEKAPHDLALIELDTALEVELQSTVWQGDSPGNFLATLAGFGVHPTDKPDPISTNDKLDVGWLKASATAKTVQWTGYNPVEGDAEKNSVPCPGDSGGPIYLNAWTGTAGSRAPVLRTSMPAVGCRDERRQVLGVVSFVQPVRNASNFKKDTCFQWTRGAGALLTPHLQWICETSRLYCNKN